MRPDRDPMPRTILVIDDDARIRESLSRVLAQGGARVEAAESAEGGLAVFQELSPDLVISDIRMPGMDGLELLETLKERAPEVDIVLMTAFDDLPTIARAMKEGAADLLVKPLDLHQLRAVVERVFQDRRSRAGGDEDGALLRDAAEGTERLVGHDPRMVEIFKVVGQMSATRANVIIRGESGTGKELIARAIHENSAAASEPFVAVNCTALPSTLLESELFGHVRGAFTGASSDRKGRFALAGKGTLLLDEIGDTSPEFQAKLLRVLQEGEFYPVGAEQAEQTEARVLAATHRDLEELVKEGLFREDLYYRLRVVEILLPPLRERRGDIPELARHLVEKASLAVGRPPPTLHDDVVQHLVAHDWPGNVRELENCLTRAVVMATGNVIRPEHLALEGGAHAATPHLRTLAAVEGEYVAAVLKATGGNKSRAAEILDISRPRLRRILERTGPGEDE